jgi:hypothetical protein
MVFSSYPVRRLGLSLPSNFRPTALYCTARIQIAFLNKVTSVPRVGEQQSQRKTGLP